MAKILVSDVSGEVIPDGRGATVRIVFHGDESRVREVHLTDDEAAYLANGGLRRLVKRSPNRTQLRRRHRRAYEPWTSEEDARLHRDHRAGATLAGLAALLERQPSAVRARLRKLGLNE